MWQAMPLPIMALIMTSALPLATISVGSVWKPKPATARLISIRFLTGTEGLALNPSASGGFNTFVGPREALGEVNALSFMLNGLFDFGDDDGVQGFVGGGAGVSPVLTWTVASTQTARGCGMIPTPGLPGRSSLAFVAPISDSWDVGLKYRYFNAPDVNLVDPLGRSIDTDLDHALRCSARSLTTLAVKRLRRLPRRLPRRRRRLPRRRLRRLPRRRLPPEPCNTGPYIVFFDFDKVGHHGGSCDDP